MSHYESYENEFAGESPIQEWEAAGPQGEYAAEYAGESAGEYAGESEYETEALETALAQELMEVSSEAELEQFLGSLIKGAGKFFSSGVGKAVGGVLKGIARTALPMVGSALGSFVLPGVGTALGGQLGSMASKLFEVGELETLTESEAEYEAARRFVRFGRATARLASMAPANVPPEAAARSAAITAAQRYAPGLLRPSGTPHWRDRRASRLPVGRAAYRRRRPSYRSGAPWQWGAAPPAQGWYPPYGPPAGWGGPPPGQWGPDQGDPEPFADFDEVGEGGFELQ